MENIQITMRPEEKQNFYAKKVRLLIEKPPVTDEERRDCLNTLNQLINESEENVSYANKIMYLKHFVSFVTEDDFLNELTIVEL